MTPAELKAYIAGQLVVPVTQVAKIINSFNQVVDFITTEVADAIPTWTALLTFQTDGTDDGKYCKHPDNTGNTRIFETKTDDNIANEPPTDPLITETTNWKEVSASASAAIPEWAPGVYGPGLVIVYHSHSVNGRGLYVLIEPVRPFTSANIETEVTQWAQIAGSAKQTVEALSIVAGSPDTLTVDCTGKDSKVIRYTAADDHDFSLTNTSDLVVLHVHARLSNTVIIQFDSTVVSQIEQAAGVTWDDANQQLSIEAVTDEDWEFSLTRVDFGSGSIFKLKVSGPFV